MSEQNPFLPPEAPLAGMHEYDPEGRAVDAGHAVDWLKQGWQLFLKNPGIWIAIAVIMLVIYFVLAMIPFIGQLAVTLLAPVLSGGVLLGCKSLAEGGELKIDHLFAGFKQNVGNLVLVGLLYLVGVVLITVVVFLVGGGAALSGAIVGHGPGAGMAAGGFVLAALIALALSVPLIMAIWFAPALIVFRDVAPIDAMKKSFGACLKNVVPFLIYGIIAFVLLVIAALPFGLGLIVLIPVLMGSLYASYVEIFE